MASFLGLGSSFGAMQGRLSAQTDRGYQAFPWATWQSEFDEASDRELGHIEWVLDTWRADENPIVADTERVRRRINDTGVAVVSVCADYLMDTPLDASASGTWTLFRRLIETMHAIEAKWVVIPYVDQSSLLASGSLTKFLAAADLVPSVLDGSGVRVALETDLPPREYAQLLETVDREVIGVNYDIGNSAALGYEHSHELDAYGQHISLLHIKDRVRNGGSVRLGQGDAHIPEVLECLRSLRFDGPVTLQVFRDAQGLEVLDEQITWLRANCSKAEPWN